MIVRKSIYSLFLIICSVLFYWFNANTQHYVPFPPIGLRIEENSGEKMTTYYVATAANGGDNGHPGTQAEPWLTIDYAASQLSVLGGDTVRVQAGTYAAAVSPNVNGVSVSATNTFVADGAVTTWGWSFSSSSYIRVIGFTIDTSVSGGTKGSAVSITGTNTGLEFWNITCNNNAGNVVFGIPDATSRMDECIVVGVSIDGNNSPANYGNGLNVHGDNNLIAYSSIDNIDYIGIGLGGIGNRVLNVNFSGLMQVAGRHPDTLYVFANAGTSFGFEGNLWEATFNLGTPDSVDNKWFHAQNETATAWTNNVWRRNATYNFGSGCFSVYYTSATITGSKFYNNTFVEMVRADTDSISAGTFSGTDITADIRNNIFYETWGTETVNGIGMWAAQGGAVVTADYNLAHDPDGDVGYTTPWTSQSNELSNVNPQLTNVSTQDFTLGATSGAIGQGTKLATTSGGGTGTTFNVIAGGGAYFFGSNASNLTQYGGALVPGDWITVGTDVVQISSIAVDAITVTSSFTWADGEGVFFGSDNTPDIGAYPYKSGGYSLTGTWTKSGNTVTVTPSDSSLVRWAIVYEDGIPIGAANASPWQVTGIGSGTVTVKLYSMFPSGTSVITASEGQVQGKQAILQSTSPSYMRTRRLHPKL